MSVKTIVSKVADILEEFADGYRANLFEVIMFFLVFFTLLFLCFSLIFLKRESFGEIVSILHFWTMVTFVFLVGIVLAEILCRYMWEHFCVYRESLHQHEGKNKQEEDEEEK